MEDLSTREPLGLRASAWIIAFQAVALAIATYPALAKFFTAIPGNPDAWQHLWIMHWYKTCLVEGRFPFLCPEIQYPVGAPLGNFSPLHLQSLLFVPLSFLIPSDIVCYNLVWTAGLLLTGYGTSLLAWRLIGDRPAAAFAGILAMLSAPVMIHASAHLELVWVGPFPIFLVWWMEFVDRPTRKRLALAALGFLLVTASAAYYMVFAVFPAVLYVLWEAGRQGPRGAWPWLWKRAPWFAAMIAATLPAILGLFAGHVWTLTHGFSLERSRAEFNSYSAPFWGFFTPTASHLLGSLIGRDLYASLGPSAMERVPYIGVICGLLIAYAGLARAGMRRASFVWLTFALLAVLAMGASMTIGGRPITLPSSWLWDVFPPFRMTRVPSRFALFAGVPAAVLAAAGLAALRSKLPNQMSRSAAFAVLSALAIADLAMIGFGKSPPPEMPGAYAFVKERNPKAAILEIPYAPGGTELNALATYWQSIHRLKTSAGYSGHDNSLQEILIGYNSPVRAEAMTSPGYLDKPEAFPIELLDDIDFRDYLWVYLAANSFDYVVFHKGHLELTDSAPSLARLKAALADSKVFEDAGSIVYARSAMKTPEHPVPLTREGWGDRNRWLARWNRVLPAEGRVAVYNPDPARELSLALDAAAVRRPQNVRLMAGDREVARWSVHPGEYQEIATPPFRLPAGLSELTIISEPETATQQGRRPSKPSPRLRVAALHFGEASAVAARELARRDLSPSADGTRRTDTGYREAPPKPPGDTARP